MFKIGSKIGHLRIRKLTLLRNTEKTSPSWLSLVKQMESETELTQNAALKTLYQKTQASLMLDILSKLPKSQTHPLNTLRYKYFEQINLKSEIGLKMYLIMLVTNSLSNQKYTSSENKIRQLKLSKLVELLYLAFEIQDCILELGKGSKT